MWYQLPADVQQVRPIIIDMPLEIFVIMSKADITINNKYKYFITLLLVIIFSYFNENIMNNVLSTFLLTVLLARKYLYENSPMAHHMDESQIRWALTPLGFGYPYGLG